MNARATTSPVQHADRFFIGGEWVAPSSDATVDVIDSGTEEVYYTVAAAAPDDMTRAVAAARQAFDDGPWAGLTHAERAEYLLALGQGALGARRRALASCGRASRASCTPRRSTRAHRIGCARRLRGARRHVPVRGGVRAHGRRQVRSPRARAGGRGRCDHPVERAGRAHLPQDRPRAARRVHRRAQVGARGAGRGPRVRGGRGADRPAAGRAQRRHRRPRGLRAARDEPRRRQDHVHGIDRGRPAHRVAVRRAHRPLHARARWEVGGGRARRHGPRHRGQDARQGRVRAQRPGVLVADPRSSSRRAATTSSSTALATSFGKTRVGDPFDETSQLGPLVSERQTRPRPRLHRQGRRAKARRSPPAAGRPAGSRPRLLRRADRVRQRRQRIDDRPRGDLRTGARGHQGRRTSRTRCGIANDTIYGLNASVFTNDVDRARSVAGQLRSGTVGHNAFRTDFGMAFGGFKQSGIGREGGKEGSACRSSRPRP